ncbi:hypothetical protein BGZ83_008193 [Gryganskiella cystojenkinii]|nr:hypothetical protein BGZ83_008193 [Gryganskiella cystojenkinii]
MKRAAMVLGPTITPVFEQLGMLEELQSFSNNIKRFVFRNEKLKTIGTIEMASQEKIAGFYNLVCARPDLYDMMLRRIPPNKISLGKKILRVEEKDDKVIIHCSDNSAYQGDILVGADGAYSAVRQSIYSDMAAKGLLPKSDSDDLVAGYICMVGVTNPLDPEKYTQLKNEDCVTEFIGGASFSWVLLNLPDNRITWVCSVQFKSVAEAKKQRFMNSEWGPEANAPLIRQFSDFPIPSGGTMGEIFDATPLDMISKVYLEHKMFETWFYKRSVLVGDGAVNALQDAVILANCLYDLKDNTQKSITAAFQSYYDQRYIHAKQQYDNSKMVAKVVGGLNWSEKIMRAIFLNYLPKSVIKNNLGKTSAYRPLANFLPQIPFRGTGPVLPQQPSVRYLEEQEGQNKNKSSSTFAV